MNSNLHPGPPPDPDCGPTLERLQRALDGGLLEAAIESDTHTVSCPICRDRIAAAQLLIGALAHPAPVRPNPRQTDAIVQAVLEDRYANIRHRSFAVVAGLTGLLAASLMLAVWLRKPEPSVPDTSSQTQVKVDAPALAPLPHPVRIGTEFSKVGQALLDSSRPITEPAVQAPQLFSKLAASLTRPIEADDDFVAARRSLTELPDAARTGLEPVASTTQKAFARLLRDVGGVQLSVKPKS